MQRYEKSDIFLSLCPYWKNFNQTEKYMDEQNLKKIMYALAGVAAVLALDTSGIRSHLLLRTLQLRKKNLQLRWWSFRMIMRHSLLIMIQ